MGCNMTKARKNQEKQTQSGVVLPDVDQIPTLDELAALDRKHLQAYCKRFGLKAIGKTTQLQRNLEKHLKGLQVEEDVNNNASQEAKNIPGKQDSETNDKFNHDTVNDSEHHQQQTSEEAVIPEGIECSSQTREVENYANSKVSKLKTKKKSAKVARPGLDAVDPLVEKKTDRRDKKAQTKYHKSNKSRAKKAKTKAVHVDENDGDDTFETGKANDDDTSMTGKADDGDNTFVTGKADDDDDDTSVTGEADDGDGTSVIGNYGTSVTGKADDGDDTFVTEDDGDDTSVTGEAEDDTSVTRKADDADDTSVTGEADDGDDISVTGKADDGDDTSVTGKADDGDDTSVTGEADDGDDTSVTGEADDGDDTSVTGEAADGDDTSVTEKADDGDDTSVTGEADDDTSVTGKADGADDTSVTGKADDGGVKVKSNNKGTSEKTTDDCKNDKTEKNSHVSDSKITRTKSTLRRHKSKNSQDIKSKSRKARKKILLNKGKFENQANTNRTSISEGPKTCSVPSAATRCTRWCVVDGVVKHDNEVSWKLIKLKGGRPVVSNRFGKYIKFVLEPSQLNAPNDFRDNYVCGTCACDNEELYRELFDGSGVLGTRVTSSDGNMLSISKTTQNDKRGSDTPLSTFSRDGIRASVKRKRVEEHSRCLINKEQPDVQMKLPKRQRNELSNSQPGTPASPVIRKARGEKLDLPRNHQKPWRPKKTVGVSSKTNLAEDSHFAEKVEAIIKNTVPGSEEELKMIMSTKSRVERSPTKRPETL